MAVKTPVHSELSRDLTLFHITMMGLGMMIGAGVFLGLGHSIHIAGPGGVLLTFALNGLLAVFTAMSFAELSSAIPRAGGAYNFARIAFGRGTSFMAGWMEWFASSVAGSMYALTLSIYTLDFLDKTKLLPISPAWKPTIILALAIGAALFFLYTNYRGASETGRIGAFFALGQMLFMVCIGVAGIIVAIKDPSRLQNFKPFLPNGWMVLLGTMGFTYVAFEGYEVIAQAGDEAIDPKRNLPKAMLYSVIIVTITYVCVAFATMVGVKMGEAGVDMAPWEWIGREPAELGFARSIVRIMPYGNFLVTLAVLFSATSALNATIYSATRASFALGRDRMLPKFFSYISAKRKTPWVALAFTGGLIIAVLSFCPVADVVSSASIMFLFLFFLVNLCVIKVRWNMGDELTYGYLMPLFPVFPILAIVCQVLLAVWLVHLSLLAWIIAPVWILAGGVLYRLYSKSRAIATDDEILVFDEKKAPEGDEYRIMVSVANPDNAIQMVRNTYHICEAKKARVELLHMVPVPDQVPLSDAEDYMLEGREGIIEAMLYLAPIFPLSSTVRYCRNIARGIVSAVREKKINMLILGWHGRPAHQSYRVGSTIDPIMERAPCDVVVLKDCGGNQRFQSVLVPVAGGPNAALALEMAGILAQKETCEITALHVRGKRAFDVDEFIDQNMHRIDVPRERIRTTILSNVSIIDAIIQEAHNYDLVVLGATDESFIYRFTHTPVPETIARMCDKPLVMVKAGVGLRSWIKRWF